MLPPYNRPHDPAAARMLLTAFSPEWEGRGRRARRARHGDRTGDRQRRCWLGGGQEYVPFAGQSVGLVDEVRPAGEILRQTVEGADRILGQLGRRGCSQPESQRVRVGMTR